MMIETFSASVLQIQTKISLQEKNRQEIGDAVGDAVDVVGAVVDDNSSSTAPNSKPKVVMASP